MLDRHGQKAILEAAYETAIKDSTDCYAICTTCPVKNSPHLVGFCRAGSTGGASGGAAGGSTAMMASKSPAASDELIGMQLAAKEAKSAMLTVQQELDVLKMQYNALAAYQGDRL